MRTFLGRLGLVVLLAVAVGVVSSRVVAQSAVRMWATLATDLTTGVSTPVTCTASGAGCFLDVQIAGGGGTFTGPVLLPDGTASAPSLAFSSQTNTGLFFGGNNAIKVAINGSTPFLFTGTLFNVGADGTYNWTATNATANATVDTTLARGAAGAITMSGPSGTNGARFKVDALPTIGSGFGTSPSVTAGSTPLAGSVNVGTGGTATTGVITFGGTAYPSAPFCTANVVTTTAGNVRAMGVSASTTQLTLTAASAWVASDLVAYHCVSSK